MPDDIQNSQVHDPKDSAFVELMRGTKSGTGKGRKGLSTEPPFTTRPELLGNFGMVSSTHWLATAAGMSILEKGGNAFDAAVATGLALQVIEPHLNGPAGEVPMVVCRGGTDKVSAICGQGVAPAAMSIEKFKDLDVAMIPGSGLLPAMVPGSFGAWMLLLRDFGTMNLEDVFAPALGYARNGYPVVPGIHTLLSALRDLFVTEWTSSADTYLINGNVPDVNSMVTNTVLADTYTRIIRDAEASGGSREDRIEKARKIFYEGFVAEEIDKFCRENAVLDNTGRRHHGLLTGDDMARWRAEEETPVTYDYHGYTVCKGGTWSQAPVLLQALALLKGFDVAAMDPLGPDFVHTVTECAKLAFADREKFYGDPKFVDVPMETLLSDAYNDERRTLVGETASLDLRPGDIPGYGGPVTFQTPADAAAGRLGTIIADGFPAAAVKPGDTVHFDIVDRDGNMVSATPSGGWFKASPVIPGLGFPLGTRGQMFWLEEGRAGSLAPGKRPRTTLTPTLALKDGKPYMAFGTPGGDQQDQWILNFFLRHVHGGMNLQQSIDAPTFRTTHFPSSFFPRLSEPGCVAVEGRFSDETVEELRRRGHDVDVMDDWSQGRLTAVSQENGMLKAGANPRFMQTYAIGR
jgi:gamma-glutamyltranspeptidase / glutathione hydrolase